MNPKKLLSVYICFALSFLSLCYYFFLLSLPGGHHFGVTIVGIHSIMFLVIGLFLLLKYRFSLSLRVWRFFRMGLILFISWLLSFILICMILMVNARDVEIQDPDYMVILGAGLNGEYPGLTLQERLNTSIRHLSRYPALKVVVSGGQGPREVISEAQAMKQYLVRHGIAEARIITEDQSQSTMENFRYTAAVLQKLNGQQPLRILIVTSTFHLSRAQLLAKRNGFMTGSITAPTPHYLLPANLLREYFAYVKSLAFDRI